MTARTILLFALICTDFSIHAGQAHGQDFLGVVQEIFSRIEDSTKGFPQVYRVQFRVQTSKQRNADTDNWVRISLNPQNQTYLDLPGDDFERGIVRTYELMLTDDKFKNLIKSINDIQYVEIYKEGKDHDLAIVSFQLIVNNKVLYEERFSDRQWLGTYTVAGETLRASQTWRDWTWEMPNLRMSRDEIQSRLAGLVGHHLQGMPRVGWGDHGSGVRISYLRSDTVRVHLDLRGRVRHFFDPDFNIEFDVRFLQTKECLSFIPFNFKFDGDGPIGEIVDDYMRSRIQRIFYSQDKVSVKFQKLPFYIEVYPNGDLELKFGIDPKAAEREALAKDSSKRREQEEERRREQRRRNGQLEP